MSDRRARLQDRAYVVTGAASGIGLAVTRRITSEGGSVLLVDVKADGMEAAAKELRSGGARVVAAACDLGEAKSAASLGSRAMEAFGRLDGCVPCAGIIRFANVREVSPQQWDQVLNVNLRGAFFTVQGVASAMVASGRKGGSIVTISSTSAYGPRPNNADYGVSKIGIDHLTKTFALDLAPHGIRVNAVSLGVIETEMSRQVDRERGAMLGLEPGELWNKYVTEVPIGRAGSAEDVASVIAFLLSDESSYVTGECITIDGGFRLNHV